MIPVRQTVMGERGNCMAACWASILEVTIETVPDYQEVAAAGGSWLNTVNTWLSKHHGVIYVELQDWLTPVVIPDGFHLINGDGGGATAGHSCVGFCGRLVWDPHPRGTGLRSIDNYGVLVPLNDELCATWSKLWSECLCPSCIRGES